MTNSSSQPQKTGRKPSANARKLSARLLAAQAVYQSAMNEQSLSEAAKEFIDHRISMTVDGEELVEADKALFSKIVSGVADRKADLGQIIQANLSAGGNKTETLIKSILMCAAYELLAHQDIDKPIIINDYLNVGHAFFDEGEVSLLNGVLDSVAKALSE